MASRRESPSPRPSPAGRGRGGRARGFTLIELSIALVIIAVLFAAVVVSIGAVTGSKAKASAGELGGVIRSLYDTAALSGKTCRLVFEMAEPKDDEGETKYWAECAAGNLTTSKDRDGELKEIDRQSSKRGHKDKLDEDDKRFSKYTRDNPTLTDLLSVEQNRVENAAKYSEYTNSEIAPRVLPSAVHLGVWTRHQRDVANSGTAYLYFFPQGFTEKAQIYVRQGTNTWTITVSSLTGKTAVVSEELEVPRS
jgi:general secretion pathway protein H